MVTSLVVRWNWVVTFEFRDGGMFFIRTWDWYDEYIKDWAPQQNHSLSINGGNGKTNYNIALGYLSQDGMMKVNSDNYKRYKCQYLFEL